MIENPKRTEGEPAIGNSFWRGLDIVPVRLVMKMVQKSLEPSFRRFLVGDLVLKPSRDIMTCFEPLLSLVYQHVSVQKDAAVDSRK